MHRSNGEHCVVDVFGAHPVVISRVPQTATGHVHALVLALTDDHVTYEFVTVEAEPLHFVLDHRAELTRQLLDLFRIVRHVFQVDAQYILYSGLHGRRSKLVFLVQRRLVRVLQFRFRFHREHASLAAHAHHGVREAAKRAAPTQDRFRHGSAGGVARLRRLAGHDGDATTDVSWGLQDHAASRDALHGTKHAKSSPILCLR